MEEVSDFFFLFLVLMVLYVVLVGAQDILLFLVMNHVCRKVLLDGMGVETRKYGK